MGRLRAVTKRFLAVDMGDMAWRSQNGWRAVYGGRKQLGRHELYL